MQNMVDLDALERIEHFRFPPWKREVPYSVEISQLPKDQEAEAHNKRLLDDSRPITRLYTDASAIYAPGSSGIGVGLAVIQQGRTTYRYITNLGEE